MEYFKYLPVTAYTYVDVNNTPYDIAIRDITARAKIAARLRQTQVALYDYIVGDEQRPDTVSQILYKTPNYTWIVLLVANIFSLYDWPLSNREMAEYLITKYGSIQKAQTSTPGFYYTIEGDRVDATTYGLLSLNRRGPSLTPYEQEIQDNERKRRIKIVPPAFVPQLAADFRTLFR